MNSRQIIEELTDLGCIVDKPALDVIREEDILKIKSLTVKPLLINQEFLQNLRKSEENSSRDSIKNSERSEFLIQERTKRNLEGKVELVEPFINKEEKKGIDKFIKYFNDRFERMKNLLMKRRELKDAISISNVKNDGKDVSVIGIVREKYKTRKDKYILLIEDTTSEIKIHVPFQYGERIVEDEVIGVTGKASDGIIFAKEILWPEIPMPTEIKRTREEVYAAFISDLHFGSSQILSKKINKFLKWINSDHKIAEKILYLFVTGDLVDGIGKYEDQNKNLILKDIYKQYDALSGFMQNIPENIQVVLIPGDHDIVRMAEPQPAIPKKALPELQGLENIHLAPNPVWVNMHGLDDSGLSVLLYHGYSFHSHVNSLPFLRRKSDPTQIMIDLLRRRHLAPSYGAGSTLISPEDKDYLIIEKIPDIFSMGHLHSFAYSNYKGINLICASTFQAETDFQRRVGHKPDPGKVALINLKTRNAILKTF